MRPFINALSIIMLVSVVGCQQPQAPREPGGSNSLVGPTQPAVEVPSVVNITGRYILPMAVSGTLNPPLIIDLPSDRPVGFCWSLAGTSHGAQYRLGWDILDLNDDDAWETGWLPFDTPEVCSTPRTFFFGTHTFTIEVVDANALKTRAEFTLNIMPLLTRGSVDIRPYVCPNPLLVRSRGVLLVVLMGTDVVDVHDVIPESIRLADAEPIAVRVRDVATPSPDDEECECADDMPDGRDDLILTFRRSDLAQTKPISGSSRRSARREVVLFLWGHTTNGEQIVASDCVVVPGPVVRPHREPGHQGDVAKE